MIYSILRTCALHQLPAREYLVDVLQRIAEGWPRKRYAELLPDVWKPPEPLD